MIRVSPDLSVECSQWSLSISGKTRAAALKYLWEQAKAARSDGIMCNYVGMVDMWGQVPSGTCMCGRLLMLLHDVSQEEITHERFNFVMAMMEREFGGADEDNFDWSAWIGLDGC